LDTFSVHDDIWSIGSYDDPGPPDAPDAEAMLPSSNFSSYHWPVPIILVRWQCDSTATEM